MLIYSGDDYATNYYLSGRYYFQEDKLFSSSDYKYQSDGAIYHG